MGRLGHHEAGGALRELAEVHQVPVVGRAVLGVVLAHRRHDDPVGKHKVAQRHRGEQGRSDRGAYPRS
jgi:hypothetical protein